MERNRSRSHMSTDNFTLAEESLGGVLNFRLNNWFKIYLWGTAHFIKKIMGHLS